MWDNSVREDYQCYGRFAAIAELDADHVYVQDDDLIVARAAELLDSYDGEAIVANKPPAEEWRFLGCGAVFPARFASCFSSYTSRFGFDSDFCRVADVVFAYTHPYRSVWLGYRDLPWQTADNRMYKQPDHYLVRERARERTLALTKEA